MSVSGEWRIGGELLGYRIEAFLGRGGMSVVFRAHDPRLKRDVALKLLSPELAGDPAFRQRFLTESELAAALEHPNVVPIHDVGETDGQLFIVMRLVEEGDLKGLLAREGKLEARRALGLASQVAAALDGAHERGLVHRDVKPSNVLVDGRGHAYLADFGLSRRLSDQATGFDAGVSLGTPAYVAPEQIEGAAVDGRADQYSLGCLLYECLAGQRPFPRSSEAAVLFAHLEEVPPSLPGLEEVLPRALAKDPGRRYTTCTEFVEASADALGVTVRRRNLWPPAAAAVGVAVIGASLAAFFLARGGSAPASAPSGRLVRIDPATGHVRPAAVVGGRPSSVAAGGGRVWVTTQGDAGIWRVDEATGDVERLAASGPPAGIALQGSVAYVVTPSAGHTGRGGTVTRLDAETGAVIDQVQTAGQSGIASGRNGVWVAGPAAVDHIADVSRYTGKLLGHAPLPFTGHLDEEHVRFDVTSIANGEGGIWVTGDALDPELWRISPRTERVDLDRTLQFVPSSVTAGYGAVWIAAQLDDVVARVDTSSGRVVRLIRVGREPLSIAAGSGSVWVANAIDRTVMQIDPRSGRVVSTIRLSLAPTALAVSDSSVWVAGDED